MSPPCIEGSEDLEAKITAQGDKVRALKAEKADKASIDAAVKILLDLKVSLFQYNVFFIYRMIFFNFDQ